MRGVLLLVAVAFTAGCQPESLCPADQPMCCHSSDDCDSASICFPPIGFDCMVQALPPNAVACQADADCAVAGAMQICAQVSCDPTNSKSCTTGCAKDADCPEGQFCSATSHCTPQTCGMGCPPLFICNSATSNCVRQACSTDPDCPTGAVCVSNGCYPSLGQCGLLD